jgi:hypothetical protein
MTPPPSDGTIAALVEALRADAGAVSIQPIVLRAAPTTPMRLVNRVVASAYAAGVLDVLLADRMPADVALPVVPVPAGTGRSWTAHQLTREAAIALARAPHSPSPQVLAYVSPSDVWIGSSTIPGRDWPKVADELARQKGSQEDLEVAAHDAVVLSDVLELVDRAIAGKWAKWRLVDHRHRSRR